MMSPTAAPAPGSEGQSSPKILFLISEDWYFLSHRLPLARACRDIGWDVVIATRVEQHGDEIINEGFKLVPVRMRRRHRKIIGELMTISELVSIYARERPDIVHHVGLKPVIYGSLAAIMTPRRVVINALPSLDYIYTVGRVSIRILRYGIKLALRISLWPKNHWLILQNQQDVSLFEAERVSRRQNTMIIKGAGVNLRKFAPSTEPGGEIIVAFVGRMLKDKGLRETVLAARELRLRGSKVVIWLVGNPDEENPSSISKETLGHWHEEGCVRWLGYQKDMKSVWSKAHIAILPSYREGMPMALLEAAACSRPIITTDVSGCNDLVTDGVNGLLVPVHDWMALVDSIELLANSADLRARLGAAARRRVEVEYGEKTVINQTLALYRKGLCKMRGKSDILRNLERS